MQPNVALTPHNDVENQDDESDDAAASAVLGGVHAGDGHGVVAERSGHGEGGQAEVEEEGEHVFCVSGGGSEDKVRTLDL